MQFVYFSLYLQTEEMNKRLTELGEGGLRKFALEDAESTYSVYNFEGQDWKGKQTEVHNNV
tara:strand:+ start:1312 stop:1494 length:183 start_codon:yes stop_codon:yes gene_type:complete